MQRYFILINFILLIFMIISKVVIMKSHGKEPIMFAKTHKSDYLIPPFALLCLYQIFAHVFDLPKICDGHFESPEVLAWFGVIVSLAGLCLLLWALISFKHSFRIGIDNENPDKLITTGAFAVSRNPIYFAFALNVLGVFLVFPCWFFLTFLVAGCAMFHRQVLREEEFLRAHYGEDFIKYCSKVRRYI